MVLPEYARDFWHSPDSGARGVNDIGILREIRKDELELMLSWRNEPEVRANMYTRHVISLEEHLAWWARTQEATDKEYFIYEFAGIPSGIVGLTEIDTLNSNCSWALYTAGGAPRGTGVRMEMLALDYVFQNLQLRKLYCEVLASNAPVLKLHQRFGFEVEGVFRQQHKLNNSYVDIYRLGLLRFEWADRREAMLTKAISTVR